MENPIVYKKVGEWEEKGSRKKLVTKINNWLTQFDEDEQPEILTLLNHFDYYSRNNLSKSVKDLYKKFREVFPNEEFIFAKTEKEIGSSYSNIFYIEFWQKNNLYDYAQDNLTNVINQEEITNIAIVDDYMGSGNTIVNYLKKLLDINKELSKKNIVIIVLQGSQIGKQTIDNFAKDNNLKISVIASKYSKKAFDCDNIYSNNEVALHRSNYSKIYDKRINNVNYKFGYKEIEALVSFYYNTPNNTLGLFWQNICGFKGLFERHEKTKTTLSSMKRKVKCQNNLKKIDLLRNVDDYKLDIFMIYILSKQDEFSIYDACVDFGLTEKQINEILKQLITRNYFKMENNKYVVTELMKKNIRSTQIKKFKSQFDDCSDTIIKQTEAQYIPKNFSDKFSGYENK